MTPRHHKQFIGLCLRAVVVTAFTLCAASSLVLRGFSVDSTNGPRLVVTGDHPDGIYAPGQSIRWRVEVADGPLSNLVEATYALKKGGLTVEREGSLTWINGRAEILATNLETGTLLLEVKARTQDWQKIKALGGVVVSPEKIPISSPPPEDFDAFWRSKLDELSKTPPDPQLTPIASGRTNIDYWQVTMQNIRGTHIRGQLARRASPGKLPAMLIVQGAGVYGLQPSAVVSAASKGWLALNLNAHDLPLDESPAFYEKQTQGDLKEYWTIGNDDRETSYFLRMYLSCYRAAQYLTERPDWDGKTLLVIGTSQGGMQALITAGLHPAITAVIAGVPGGCDMTGSQIGRSPGWPAWILKAKGKDLEKVTAASRYYDVVNFAARIKCPVLASAGLIDEVCPAAGILAALNQVKAPKEAVILPLSDHMGTGNSQLAFHVRSRAWQAAILEGRPLPPKPPAPVQEIVITPKPYSGPLRNPLMGFIGAPNGQQEYATLSKDYVKWNQIETNAADGVDKLRAYADAHWQGVDQRNMKIIPRVFLEWPKSSANEAYWPILSYWPGDLPRDFASAQFKQRVVRMIAKMGEAWDNDPRVAFIETGLIGPWGEQHHPSPDAEMQTLIANAYTNAFKHKLLMNRYPWEFADYRFGIYWDSFGNPGWEMTRHVPELEGRLAERWKIAPMAGEMAFGVDPASTKPRLAPTPTEAVSGQADVLVRYIRRWHWTALGWVSNYDAKAARAAAGAARIQSAFGYRFVIDEVRYPSRIETGGTLPVSFKVRNLGSAPFYYNWPVEVSLLDKASREPVWKATFKDLDIRSWLPGDFSDKGKGRPVGDHAHAGFEWSTGLDYDIAPSSTKVTGTFKLSKKLPPGDYVLALAVLDPAGNLPCLRFAIQNYFKGGRHPIGAVGVGADCPSTGLEQAGFDDPATDRSIHYSARESESPL